MYQNEYLSDDEDEKLIIKKKQHLQGYVPDEKVQNDEDYQEDIQYDENGIPIEIQYDENGVAIELQYDENGMPIYEEEYDIDIIRMIQEKIANKEYKEYKEYEEPKINKDYKDKKNKVNKTLNLNDFHTFANKQMEDNKPKKFVSKRILEKTINEPKKEIIINKRCFNPRLVPYFQSEEYQNKKKSNNSINLDLESFPSLT